ncbi:hypothetical protein CR513_26525, partial [Mucuna pruriens]
MENVCEKDGMQGNTHHFDNRGSTTSRGMNGIVVANNQRFEGYIDGCGMCGSIGHPPNDCPNLQEPPPPFRPQPVQESSLEDLIKQLVMNNIQFQTSGATVSTNNMQFQQNINAIMQELKAQIGQLATIINQLQFEDSGQVPSQAILNPQENMSDITVKSGMELSNLDSENSTIMLGFADSSSVANSMLAIAGSTKMAEIDNYVPIVSDLADV